MRHNLTKAFLAVKEKKLARLQKYNDILVAKVGAWEQAIADKDATIVCQNEAMPSYPFCFVWQ